MCAARESLQSSQGAEGPAKTEGKIEGDGTFVRRIGGLHGWEDGTRVASRVPVLGATPRVRWNFFVLLMMGRAGVCRDARDA